MLDASPLGFTIPEVTCGIDAKHSPTYVPKELRRMIDRLTEITVLQADLCNYCIVRRDVIQQLLRNTRKADRALLDLCQVQNECDP